MRTSRLSGFLCGFLVLPASALAGHQVCGNRVVADSVRTCPDGSMPMFVADEIQPSRPSPAPQPSPQPTPPQERAPRAGDTRGAAATADPSYFFGVWRTNVPGAVWTSPSGYQGYDWLHARAGVSAGDLIIRPNGTYVWNSYGGKSGRWVRGDSPEFPVVLIDTVENRRWVIGVDPKHTGGRDIVVWDGNSFYYDGRK